MQRRVRLDNLRGMDPITLEVTVTDALRRPLGQLEPATLVDLLALGDAGLPPSLAAAAARFRDRIAREIADIPDGTPWASFLEELREVPAARVPTWLRDVLAAQAEREDRPPSWGHKAAAIVAEWAAVPPEPFALGTRGVRVARATAAPPPETTDGRAPRLPKAARAAASPAAPKPRRPVRVVDEERAQRVTQLLQERLARYAEGGLAETVLMIGVRKQAQEDDPAVSVADVTAALKELEARGVVRRSAGRVFLARRW